MTKQRLLDAATAEFAEFGLGGARVDRIAERSGVNKRMIYAYFGGKEALFDTVLSYSQEQLVATIQLDTIDLPGYAGKLFDYLVEHPERRRLSLWRSLEAPTASTDVERSATNSKVRELRDADSGKGIDADSLLVFIMGIVSAWPNASAASPSASGMDRAAQRADVVEAVRRLTSPTP